MAIQTRHQNRGCAGCKILRFQGNPRLLRVHLRLRGGCRCGGVCWLRQRREAVVNYSLDTLQIAPGGDNNRPKHQQMRSPAGRPGSSVTVVVPQGGFGPVMEPSCICTIFYMPIGVASNR